MALCPIAGCVCPVPGELRICPTHYKLVPRPQQDALAHYARWRKGGPAHVAAYERALESVNKVVAARATVMPVPNVPVALPYQDD